MLNSDAKTTFAVKTNGVDIGNTSAGGLWEYVDPLRQRNAAGR